MNKSDNTDTKQETDEAEVNKSDDAESESEILTEKLDDESNENIDEIMVTPTVIVNLGGIQEIKKSQYDVEKESVIEESENIYLQRDLSQTMSSTKLIIIGSTLMLFLLLFAFTTIKIDDYLSLCLYPSQEMYIINYKTLNSAFNQYKEMVNVEVFIEGTSRRSVYTPLITVGELAEIMFSGLSNTSDDKYETYELNYTKGRIISDGMELIINHIEYQYETLTEGLEYPINIIEVQTIPPENQEVVQDGQNGVITRTYRHKYVNGEPYQADVVEEIIDVEAKPQIIHKGVGGVINTKSGYPYNFLFFVDVEATAYGVDTGYGGDSKYTYTGKIAKQGIIAVDPEVIPLGSKVFITGSYGEIGICYAEDIGEAITGNRIDIHMGNDLETQLQFGRREMRVYIISTPDK